MKILNSTAISIVDLLVDLLDAGTGAGEVKVYDDTAAQPAGPGTAVPGTSVLLATFTCSDPAFGAAADDTGSAKATANTIADVTAAATGTALWFRASDGDGNAVEDGDCGESGSGADMILNSTAITSGSDVSVESWTVSHPE